MQGITTDMQIPRGGPSPATSAGEQRGRETPATPDDFRVIRRNGALVGFEPAKIAIAMTKAFLAVHGGQAAASASTRDLVGQLTASVVSALVRGKSAGATFHIEDIQDHVELALMRSGQHEVARAYVLYRERRAQERAALRPRSDQPAPVIHVLDGDARRPLDLDGLRELLEAACQGLGEVVDAGAVLDDAARNLYDGVPIDEVYKAAILSARSRIENDPAYSQVAARLLLHVVRREVLGEEVSQPEMASRYAEYFGRYVRQATQAGLLDPVLLQFDLHRLGAALAPDRDLQFDYLGLQTLYDRYFLQVGGRRIELPQSFFMRVAMGLARNEIDREARAIEFYELLSSFDFMSSTPTLFNSGTQHSQLSSCYLTTVSDDLDGIFDAIKENALLAKYAGGLGNDWTPVRALGAHIRGTNGKSQGVVPFLKVVNDTAVAVNQCFAPDTGVYTPAGVRPLREIAPGDLVLGIDGDYREVMQRLVYNQSAPMVELRIKHAIEPLRVTAGHPVWAICGVPMEQSSERTLRWLARGTVAPAWVEAGALARGDYVAQVIPQEVVPVEGFDADDARMYGILLGDGRVSSDGQQFTVAGHSMRDGHLEFVRAYLGRRAIRYAQTNRAEGACEIRWSAGLSVRRNATTGRIAGSVGFAMPFDGADFHGADGRKAIAARFAHLPLYQAIRLVQGLIETSGNVSRGKEILFSNPSRALVEGLRYQMLRLGVPVAGALRERAGRRDRGRGGAGHGQPVAAPCDLRIPAVPELASLVGARSLTKRNWLRVGRHLFSRLRSIEPIEPTPFVIDLKVDGVRSYMTTGALAHNGGKRKGAVCAYLETWHLDIEEFLELRKNTGDERRRTPDMNTANWIPDLFMKRVNENADWTLFSPSDCPDLHELYGKAFEEAYRRHEERALRGELALFRRIPAVQLWRRMLSMLFETGHPWLTFKDACNVRSPQRHVGVVHGSNLCTEITLNTDDDEIAVCNLGSVNLVAHMREEADGWVLDQRKLAQTVRTAMRMLDNVIDINYYAVAKARNANLRHRPVGLGLMGFQDCLHRMRVPYASDAAVEFADRSTEALCYFAYRASTELAEERGPYASFRGSLWDRGILPRDSLRLLADERSGTEGSDADGSRWLEVDGSETLDWAALRERIRAHGMRNSNCVAIAPTATISNIVGVSAGIDPTYRNLYVKSNLSGEFTVVNRYLVRDLKRSGLWDEVMVADLKYFDGALERIDRVPAELRALYASAFEVDPRWLIECAARRQKWIDQAQSLNLYMAGASGRKLHEMYMLAWRRGLKTTYYLRTLGATSAEKSTTGQIGELNSVSHDTTMHAGFAYAAASTNAHVQTSSREGDDSSVRVSCAVDEVACEGCQ